MKLITIMLASAVMLLLQVGMPLAQEVTNTTLDTDAPSSYGYCPRAYCPSGHYFDYHKCACMKEFDSICPNGYYPVTLGKGYCVCRRVVESTCPKGWYRDSYSCRCNFRSFPSCPDYTTLTKYGAPDKCTGSTNATCPPGYELLDNCSCVAHVPRICEGGEIAADGCSCKVKTEPLCRGYQCTLNTETCYCQQRHSDPYTCYPKKYCRGYSSTFYSLSECCDGYRKSYQYQGRCHHCQNRNTPVQDDA